MSKFHPKPAKHRITHQRSKIDRLPLEVRAAIIPLRADHTWVQIEERSALPFNPHWRTEDGGFVNWDALPLVAQRLLPKRRIPRTNLHRWFGLRAGLAEAT